MLKTYNSLKDTLPALLSSWMKSRITVVSSEAWPAASILDGVLGNLLNCRGEVAKIILRRIRVLKIKRLPWIRELMSKNPLLYVKRRSLNLRRLKIKRDITFLYSMLSPSQLGDIEPYPVRDETESFKRDRLQCRGCKKTS